MCKCRPSIDSLKCHFPQFVKHIMLNAHSFCSLAECAPATTVLTLFRTKPFDFEDGSKCAMGKKNCLPNSRWEKATPCEATSHCVTFSGEHISNVLASGLQWCVCVWHQFFLNIVRHQHCRPSLSRIRSSVRCVSLVALGAAKISARSLLKFVKYYGMHWPTLHIIAAAVCGVRFSIGKRKS